MGHSYSLILNMSKWKLLRKKKKLFLLQKIDRGAKISFQSRDTLKPREDLTAAQPTVLIIIPRVLIKFYNEINYQIANQLAFMRNNIKSSYDQTQVSGQETVELFLDTTQNHEGGIVASAQLKLQDVPKMCYFSTDNDENENPMLRGEICIRGYTVFVGYQLQRR
ncbi:long-chain-fatty-acid-CoA ligase, putative (macronuclear) [Tetrahymena thermophila SB210]|uniref:Long-chain-fatty-acid-CoA ligase, putative n=1 Tax=Tetrahymena thermophila (strain SB210) TaxID=312017 RepID=Q22F02_TETTS|nr:long-chain-fatty-acid-CoA ligase, putative [Tetrahymena thermophila SB210]EAR83873.2 long-chain-fatty-acid-CoA ligase, putative [Tetrahymena thermophila SB210]|eukprot:XP_001031536.2 long-chain-fatty-acid-CoA ligase, putative [Tetrahymena thermophila SB210]